MFSFSSIESEPYMSLYFTSVWKRQQTNSIVFNLRLKLCVFFQPSFLWHHKRVISRTEDSERRIRLTFPLISGGFDWQAGFTYCWETNMTQSTFDWNQMTAGPFSLWRLCPKALVEVVLYVQQTHGQTWSRHMHNTLNRNIFPGCISQISIFLLQQFMFGRWTTWSSFIRFPLKSRV